MTKVPRIRGLEKSKRRHFLTVGDKVIFSLGTFGSWVALPKDGIVVKVVGNKVRIKYKRASGKWGYVTRNLNDVEVK